MAASECVVTCLTPSYGDVLLTDHMEDDMGPTKVVVLDYCPDEGSAMSEQFTVSLIS